MRCVQKRAAEERAEFIRKNRREVDPYTGLTDTVDLIVALYTPRAHDPLIVYKPCPFDTDALFARLGTQDAKRLEQVAVAAKRNGRDNEADDLATGLAVFTTFPIPEIQTTWIDSKHYLPAVIFRGAPDTVRDRLIELLDSFAAGEKRTLEVNHALCALAWIGDETVARTFARWEAEPPRWRKSLHVGPSVYAQTAGWSLEGRRRTNLYFDTCFSIEPETDKISDLAAFQKSSERCPWCQQALVELISLPPYLARAITADLIQSRFPVLTCAVCTCYGEHVFAKVSHDGHATLHGRNEAPKVIENESSDVESSWSAVSISLVPGRMLIAPGFEHIRHCSRIGGIPAWVQDSAFPRCPDCSATMKFLAQFDNEAFPNDEGVYYAFVCLGCRTTATCYQQT
jgi:hypothetical protein